MSEYHYGSGPEVRNLGTRLKKNLEEVRNLSAQGTNYLKRMQESVRDDAYREAEEIVGTVTKTLLNGLDDAFEVVTKLNKYGDYLDTL